MKPTSAVMLATLIAVSSAWAEGRPPAEPDAKACAPGERTLPGSAQPSHKPPVTTGEGPNIGGENLSDKLARTDGVICPENVDPSIKAPTPDAGKMPVIPPPGSPGGDPTVRPK